jgi:hypothetical protein
VLVALGIALLTALSLPSKAEAQTTDTFYYWVAPVYPKNSPPPTPDSFVIAVNSTQRSQIESILSQNHPVQFDGHIVAAAASYNKNYYAPGHPVWNWHFTSIDKMYDASESGIPSGPGPEDNYYSLASQIAADPNAWIARNGDYYNPLRYAILRQIDPSNPDAMANVSNRGLAGSGEKALIAGFIISGGEPRNVVIRALGPSLAASGVQQYATNPRIDLFDASGNRLTPNDDWKSDARANELSQTYPSLAPANDKESARLVTLLPGNYTVQGTNVDGTDGVVLLEVYDVDYQSP